MELYFFALASGRDSHKFKFEDIFEDIYSDD